MWKPNEIINKSFVCFVKARKSSDSGTVRMKRSLLVQAGQTLSPDAFLMVLESESETKGKIPAVTEKQSINSCDPVAIAHWNNFHNVCYTKQSS